MAIDTTDILTALREAVASTLKVEDIGELEGLHHIPVEVQWPDQTGTSGETRKVIAVIVKNSGDPEVPTLRLICGTSYTDEDLIPYPLLYQD